nr:classical arabinogalactan protein 9-like [Lolium perenne]
MATTKAMASSPVILLLATILLVVTSVHAHYDCPPPPAALTPEASTPAPVASTPAMAPVASAPEPVPSASAPPPIAIAPTPVASAPAPPQNASAPSTGSGQCKLSDVAEFGVCVNLNFGRMGMASRDMCCRRIRGKPIVNAVTCLCTTFWQFNVRARANIGNNVNAVLEICGISRIPDPVCLLL